MNIRLKNAAGAIVVISGLPAFAQTSAVPPASTASTSPPPPPPPSIVAPGDPTWFVAGLFTGLVVGYVACKVLGGNKAQSVR